MTKRLEFELQSDRIKEQVLKDSRYWGKYITIQNQSCSEILSYDSNLDNALDIARRKGCRNPLLTQVPSMPLKYHSSQLTQIL